LIFRHFIPDGNILVLFFLLEQLKIKLVVLPYLILLPYIHIPSRRIETCLPSWLTKISRPARQPDVFLLLILFARKFTFLTRTKLRYLISLLTLLILTFVRLCLIFSLIIMSRSIIICGCSSGCRFFNIFLIHILYAIFVVLCL
jgi:hypothetical protein